MEYCIIIALMIILLSVLIIFKLREKELTEKIKRDEFTNLYNKTASEEKINKELKKNVNGALFLIDIDNFKEINDTYGHLVGDNKLLSLAVMLTDCFKDRKTIVGRAGGDEFIIFFTYYDKKDIIEKASVLMDIMKEDNLNMTFSMGVSTRAENDTYFSMLARADKLLYDAKKDGKKSYKTDF